MGSEMCIRDREEAEIETSVDEDGTEWWEDEDGTWWYRLAGEEEWQEYNE